MNDHPWSSTWHKKSWWNPPSVDLASRESLVLWLHVFECISSASNRVVGRLALQTVLYLISFHYQNYQCMSLLNIIDWYCWLLSIAKNNFNRFCSAPPLCASRAPQAFCCSFSIINCSIASSLDEENGRERRPVLNSPWVEASSTQPLRCIGVVICVPRIKCINWAVICGAIHFGNGY